MSSRIPKRYRDKSLDNYRNVPLEVLTTLQEDKSLLLYGPCGTGKTHLAIGLIKKLVTEKKNLIEVEFLPAVEFFLQLKRSFSANDITEEDIVSKYSTVTLLFIDDLGAEKVSDWSRQMLYTLIDRRYRECKQTIITTNLTPSQISEQIDDRIMSRLSEMGEIVELKGKDKRITK